MRAGAAPDMLRLHASCAARDGAGVLLLGRSGAGKSDLLLRLVDRGFDLVADDQVLVENRTARPADNVAGLIEIRGVGLLRLAHVAPVTLRLVLALDHPTMQEAASADPDDPVDPGVARLPRPLRHRQLGLPLLRIAPFEASSCFRAELALDCVVGRRSLVAGFLETPS